MTLPEPQIIRSAVAYRGQLAVLSIFRTCWQSEGSALFEMVNHDGTANTHIENGSWRAINSNGSRALDVDIDAQDFDGWHELLDALMSQVVRNGSALGLNSFLPQGDQN